MPTRESARSVQRSWQAAAIAVAPRSVPAPEVALVGRRYDDLEDVARQARGGGATQQGGDFVRRFGDQESAAPQYVTHGRHRGAGTGRIREDADRDGGLCRRELVQTPRGAVEEQMPPRRRRSPEVVA